MELSSMPSTETSQTQEPLDEQQIRMEILLAQKDAHQAQALSQQSLNLPHRVYQLTSLSHDGVCWVAKAMLAEDTVLVGRGNCPMTALNDFDEQWLGIK
jgi:hypothetical protein